MDSHGDNMATDIVQETRDRLANRKKFGFDESLFEGVKESGKAVGHTLMEKFIKPFSQAVDINNFDPNNPESLIAASLIAGSGGRGAGGGAGTVGSGMSWKEFMKLPKDHQQLLKMRGRAPVKPKETKIDPEVQDLVEAQTRLNKRLADKKAAPEIAKQQKARQDRVDSKYKDWKTEFDKTSKEMRDPATTPQRLNELKPYMEYVAKELKQAGKAKANLAGGGSVGAAKTSQSNLNRGLLADRDAENIKLLRDQYVKDNSSRGRLVERTDADKSLFGLSFKDVKK